MTRLSAGGSSQKLGGMGRNDGMKMARIGHSGPFTGESGATHAAWTMSKVGEQPALASYSGASDSLETADDYALPFPRAVATSCPR